MKKERVNQHKMLSSKYLLAQIKSLFTTALIFVLVTSAIIEGSIVPTPSMSNTILPGDRLIINKFVFGASTPSYIPFTDIELPYFRLPAFREPERNEIIVFRYPGDINQIKDDAVEFWVKRCVAVPHDTLEIRDKVIFVNGEKLPIPPNINYHIQPIKKKGEESSNIFPNYSKWNEDNYGPIVIPRKGDVISLSAENIDRWRTLINREIGEFAVSLENKKVKINDKAVNSFTVKNDYYFMMGDNRDNSLDSRHWGFLSRENIVGKPILIFWSWDSDIPFNRPIDLLTSIRFDRIAKILK